jgi:hypothetical protein
MRVFRGAASVALSSLLVLLSGCPQSYDSTTWTPGDGTAGTAEEHDELFVQQTDPASWRFSTNDSAFWGPSGYTLWALPLPDQPTFAQRDVVLVKESGNAWTGYGIIFCHLDTGDPSLGESMLLVMINTQQQYSLGEVTGSHYTPYTSPTWVSCPGLFKGYGVANGLKVTRDAGGLFTLYLNQGQVMTFHDGRTPTPTGGANGYLVVISPQDSFPQSPVSVVFTEK